MSAVERAAGTVLVIDGGGVCRAPIVEFTLKKQLAGAGWLGDAAVHSRGIEALEGEPMCDTAQIRLGYTQPAIAFFGAYRSERLTTADIAAADIVLTAERQQRSSVVRMLPGTQATVFTWKEALVLATVLTDRVNAGTSETPTDLASLAHGLHSVRGTVPMIEPPVRTAVFHLRRPVEQGDPLTIVDGHADASMHRDAANESWRVALTLGSRLADLAESRLPSLDTLRPQQPRWWRQRA